MKKEHQKTDIKTYYLTLSEKFPTTHKRAGEPTEFKVKALVAINQTCRSNIQPKLHTIRANYHLWRQRFEKIAAGKACLSIRQWVGKPYGKGSRQVEIVRLTREDGIGIQQLTFTGGVSGERVALIDGVPLPSLRVLADNDGLALDDWLDWFKDYNLSRIMAIIHFTSYRY